MLGEPIDKLAAKAHGEMEQLVRERSAELVMMNEALEAKILSERNAAQIEILRLRRLQAAPGGIDRTIARADERDTPFRDIRRSPLEEGSAPTASPDNGGTVLVMDDEQIVRNVVAKMLKTLGYQATTCVDGGHAVDLYEKAMASGTPFLAAIMDLNIPGGMGGREAAQQILAIDPAARLIVSSNNTYDPAMTDHESYGFCSVMPKPCKIIELKEVLTALPRQ